MYLSRGPVSEWQAGGACPDIDLPSGPLLLANLRQGSW